MKRGTSRKILIEIEKIQTKKQPPAKIKPQAAKLAGEPATLSCADAFAKNTNRLEHLFDKLF